MSATKTPLPEVTAGESRLVTPDGYSDTDTTIRRLERLERLYDGDAAPHGLGSTQVTVVIPMMNEAANLPHILPLIPTWVHEIVFVDGNSTDDSIKTALTLCPSARVIIQGGRGKGDALACGFAAARGDIIVMLDADGSTDPREIGAFVQPLLDGADFAKGSRCMQGAGSDDISRVRSAGNAALRGTVNLLFGTHYTDLCYGYNAFWARCLDAMRIDCDGFEVETLMNVRVAKARLNVAEVPSIEHARLHGNSNLHAWRDGWRVLRTILRERFRGHRPDRAEQFQPNFRELEAQCA